MTSRLSSDGTKIWGIGMLKKWEGLCVLLLLCLKLDAQVESSLFKTDYRISEENLKELNVVLDIAGFFKDNEYSGGIMKGYTLPGFRLNPKITYNPLDNIRLEVGAHLLRYWGATEYPCFAYSDIATWQGEQYQRGFHALPWLRAQIGLGKGWNIVLGDIYGGASHGLIEPLYNPELNSTADPEAGAQVLYDSKFLHLDIWGSWDSFIFKSDTHQEAFSVGVSARLNWNESSSLTHFYTVIQALAQHRGGEIDTITVRSVQTLANGAAGFGGIHNFRCRHFRSLGGEFDVAGYYQQAGDLLPYDKGYGLYFRTWADIDDFRVKAAFWHSKHFVPVFGSPFFGSISQAEEGVTYPKQQMFHWGAEYKRSFGKNYALGIEADVYHHIGLGTSFSAGIFMRLTPGFLIKKF